MGRKKKEEEEQTQTITPETVDMIRQSVLAEQEQDEVNNILNMFGPNTNKVSLQRYDEDGRKWKHLGTFEPLPEFVDFVKDRFGGGDYRVLLFDKTGQYIKGGMKTFSIDAMFIPKKNVNEPVSTSINALVSPDPHFARLEMLLGKLIELQIAGTQGQKVDPLEMVEKIARILKPETVQVSNPVTEMIGMFKQGLEMGQMMNSDSYWPVIEKLGTPALELLSRVASGNGQTIVNKATQVNPKEVKPVNWFNELAKFVPHIIPSAKQNVETEDVVDEILDRVPPMLYDAIYEEIIKPDFLSRMITVVPAIKEHESWFKEFVEKFKEILSSESEPALNKGGEDE